MILASCLTRQSDKRLLASAVCHDDQAAPQMLQTALDMLTHAKLNASGSILNPSFHLHYVVDEAVAFTVLVDPTCAVTTAQRYLFELRSEFQGYLTTPQGYMAAMALTPLACTAFESEMDHLHTKYNMTLVIHNDITEIMHLTWAVQRLGAMYQGIDDEVERQPLFLPDDWDADTWPFHVYWMYKASAVVGHGKAVQRVLKKGLVILANTKPTASGTVLEAAFCLHFEVDGSVIFAVVVHRQYAASLAHKYLYELREAFYAYQMTPLGHMCLFVRKVRRVDTDECCRTGTALTPLACAAFEPEMHRLHARYDENLVLHSDVLLDLHLTLHLPAIREAARAINAEIINQPLLIPDDEWDGASEPSHVALKRQLRRHRRLAVLVIAVLLALWVWCGR
ncbi:hypothetical protein SDRG_12115 [Saprolegnia diclina VS20]|uniref:Longin domain-containing protein n=1 Tax=Saprolegnia diclina (strain VS20) TaxID=1156394 RepID=T0Q9V0_SAPDV|nr:hypothetical protein SDRG_12115 [Saprolegnia diclina VS20]EQC30265.1 hypothetical protein SDRG_12115 [Saprolegnia diclina VS20]|eukprot:XP_008616397.1 hypothetical protein SDRG_12115 [Saprolegnia diclina VS20]